ncbi:cobyrinate a,c-diamide synthase [Metabacillus malikii]|uniref:Cobyrinate a,c-diamide synthase n=1 Tax=Metabacillus malikii TaxID=1504265 RepID=A0ABT9Z9Q7_9BACI|nr:cobyrinate a,c-diamide synthase [Metabacillus malikii]MDQ0228988.1 cobyrinic acid a,c-diamide synthase [Metabacillus malikii]
MTDRRIVIAGTGSGVGKTTVTLGLMAALIKKGLIVQGFKCGPDYIDPSYHTAVTKRVSRNLDSWMLSDERVLDILSHGQKGADISIIEGVMGFFDGKQPLSNEGSTAEISMLTKSPVLLVVNCESMARSAAAIVKGFQLFAEDVNLVAVIANKVGSEGHYQLVKAAIEQECNIPVIGYLKRELDIEIPERHLGLIPSIERGELDSFFTNLGENVLETIDVERLLDLAETEEILLPSTSLFGTQTDRKVKIAVAKDAAFNFYYPENLELLEHFGAELYYFSPLANEELPNDVDGLYLGGGFPEEFARILEKNSGVRLSIKRAIQSGLPTIAECGGFMYLTNSIKTSNSETYQMVGVIPGDVHMQTRLAALGYREVKGNHEHFLLKGQVARGHEFHYSTFHTIEKEIPYAFETTGMRGTQLEGYATENLIAGYTHLHFGSCPKIAENWVKRCLEYKNSIKG